MCSSIKADTSGFSDLSLDTIQASGLIVSANNTACTPIATFDSTVLTTSGCSIVTQHQSLPTQTVVTASCDLEHSPDLSLPSTAITRGDQVPSSTEYLALDSQMNRSQLFPVANMNSCDPCLYNDTSMLPLDETPMIVDLDKFTPPPCMTSITSSLPTCSMNAAMCASPLNRLPCPSSTPTSMMTSELSHMLPHAPYSFPNPNMSSLSTTTVVTAPHTNSDVRNTCPTTTSSNMPPAIGSTTSQVISFTSGSKASSFGVGTSASKSDSSLDPTSAIVAAAPSSTSYSSLLPSGLQAPTVALPPSFVLTLTPCSTQGDFPMVHLNLPDLPTVILHVLPLPGAKMGEQYTIDVSTQLILSGIQSALANGTVNGGPIMLSIAPSGALPPHTITTTTPGITTTTTTTIPTPSIGSANNTTTPLSVPMNTGLLPVQTTVATAATTTTASDLNSFTRSTTSTPPPAVNMAPNVAPTTMQNVIPSFAQPLAPIPTNASAAAASKRMRAIAPKPSQQLFNPIFTNGMAPRSGSRAPASKRPNNNGPLLSVMSPNPTMANTPSASSCTTLTAGVVATTALQSQVLNTPTKGKKVSILPVTTSSARSNRGRRKVNAPVTVSSFGNNNNNTQMVFTTSHTGPTSYANFTSTCDGSSLFEPSIQSRNCLQALPHIPNPYSASTQALLPPSCSTTSMLSEPCATAGPLGPGYMFGGPLPSVSSSNAPGSYILPQPFPFPGGCPTLPPGSMYHQTTNCPSSMPSVTTPTVPLIPPLPPVSSAGYFTPGPVATMDPNTGMLTHYPGTCLPIGASLPSSSSTSSMGTDQSPFGLSIIYSQSSQNPVGFLIPANGSQQGSIVYSVPPGQSLLQTPQMTPTTLCNTHPMMSLDPSFATGFTGSIGPTPHHHHQLSNMSSDAQLTLGAPGGGGGGGGTLMPVQNPFLVPTPSTDMTVSSMMPVYSSTTDQCPVSSTSTFSTMDESNNGIKDDLISIAWRLSQMDNGGVMTMRHQDAQDFCDTDTELQSTDQVKQTDYSYTSNGCSDMYTIAGDDLGECEDAEIVVLDGGQHTPPPAMEAEEVKAEERADCEVSHTHSATNESTGNADIDALLAAAAMVGAASGVGDAQSAVTVPAPSPFSNVTVSSSQMTLCSSSPSTSIGAVEQTILSVVDQPRSVVSPAMTETVMVTCTNVLETATSTTTTAKTSTTIAEKNHSELSPRDSADLLSCDLFQDFNTSTCPTAFTTDAVDDTMPGFDEADAPPSLVAALGCNAQDAADLESVLGPNVDTLDEAVAVSASFLTSLVDQSPGLVLDDADDDDFPDFVVSASNSPHPLDKQETDVELPPQDLTRDLETDTFQLDYNALMKDSEPIPNSRQVRSLLRNTDPAFYRVTLATDENKLFNKGQTNLYPTHEADDFLSADFPDTVGEYTTAEQFDEALMLLGPPPSTPQANPDECDSAAVSSPVVVPLKESPCRPTDDCKTVVKHKSNTVVSSPSPSPAAAVVDDNLSMTSTSLEHEVSSRLQNSKEEGQVPESKSPQHFSNLPSPTGNDAPEDLVDQPIVETIELDQLDQIVADIDRVSQSPQTETVQDNTTCEESVPSKSLSTSSPEDAIQTSVLTETVVGDESLDKEYDDGESTLDMRLELSKSTISRIPSKESIEEFPTTPLNSPTVHDRSRHSSVSLPDTPPFYLRTRSTSFSELSTETTNQSRRRRCRSASDMDYAATELACYPLDAIVVAQQPTNVPHSNITEEVSVCITEAMVESPCQSDVNDDDDSLNRELHITTTAVTVAASQSGQNSSLFDVLASSSALFEAAVGEMTSDSDISPVKSSVTELASLDRMLKTCQRRSQPTLESSGSKSSSVTNSSLDHPIKTLESVIIDPAAKSRVTKIETVAAEEGEKEEEDSTHAPSPVKATNEKSLQHRTRSHVSKHRKKTKKKKAKQSIPPVNKTPEPTVDEVEKSPTTLNVADSAFSLIPNSTRPLSFGFIPEVTSNETVSGPLLPAIEDKFAQHLPRLNLAAAGPLFPDWVPSPEAPVVSPLPADDYPADHLEEKNTLIASTTTASQEPVIRESQSLSTPSPARIRQHVGRRHKRRQRSIDKSVESTRDGSSNSTSSKRSEPPVVSVAFPLFDSLKQAHNPLYSAHSIVPSIADAPFSRYLNSTDLPSFTSVKPQSLSVKSDSDMWEQSGGGGGLSSRRMLFEDYLNTNKTANENQEQQEEHSTTHSNMATPAASLSVFSETTEQQCLTPASGTMATSGEADSHMDDDATCPSEHSWSTTGPSFTTQFGFSAPAFPSLRSNGGGGGGCSQSSVNSYSSTPNRSWSPSGRLGFTPTTSTTMKAASVDRTGGFSGNSSSHNSSTTCRTPSHTGLSTPITSMLTTQPALGGFPASFTKFPSDSATGPLLSSIADSQVAGMSFGSFAGAAAFRATSFSALAAKATVSSLLGPDRPSFSDLAKVASESMDEKSISVDAIAVMETVPATLLGANRLGFSKVDKTSGESVTSDPTPCSLASSSAPPPSTEAMVPTLIGPDRPSFSDLAKSVSDNATPCLTSSFSALAAKVTVPTLTRPDPTSFSDLAKAVPQSMSDSCTPCWTNSFGAFANKATIPTPLKTNRPSFSNMAKSESVTTNDARFHSSNNLTALVTEEESVPTLIGPDRPSFSDLAESVTDNSTLHSSTGFGVLATKTTTVSTPFGPNRPLFSDLTKVVVVVSEAVLDCSTPRSTTSFSALATTQVAILEPDRPSFSDMTNTESKSVKNDTTPCSTSSFNALEATVVVPTILVPEPPSPSGIVRSEPDCVTIDASPCAHATEATVPTLIGHDRPSFSDMTEAESKSVTNEASPCSSTCSSGPATEVTVPTLMGLDRPSFSDLAKTAPEFGTHSSIACSTSSFSALATNATVTTFLGLDRPSFSDLAKAAPEFGTDSSTTSFSALTANATVPTLLVPDRPSFSDLAKAAPESVTSSFSALTANATVTTFLGLDRPSFSDLAKAAPESVTNSSTTSFGALAANATVPTLLGPDRPSFSDLAKNTTDSVSNDSTPCSSITAWQVTSQNKNMSSVHRLFSYSPKAPDEAVLPEETSQRDSPTTSPTIVEEQPKTPSQSEEVCSAPSPSSQNLLIESSPDTKPMLRLTKKRKDIRVRRSRKGRKYTAPKSHQPCNVTTTTTVVGEEIPPVYVIPTAPTSTYSPSLLTNSSLPMIQDHDDEPICLVTRLEQLEDILPTQTRESPVVTQLDSIVQLPSTEKSPAIIQPSDAYSPSQLTASNLDRAPETELNDLSGSDAHTSTSQEPEPFTDEPIEPSLLDVSYEVVDVSAFQLESFTPLQSDFQPSLQGEREQSADPRVSSSSTPNSVGAAISLSSPEHQSPLIVDSATSPLASSPPPLNEGASSSAACPPLNDDSVMVETEELCCLQTVTTTNEQPSIELPVSEASHPPLKLRLNLKMTKHSKVRKIKKQKKIPPASNFVKAPKSASCTPIIASSTPTSLNIRLKNIVEQAAPLPPTPPPVRFQLRRNKRPKEREVRKYATKRSKVTRNQSLPDEPKITLSLKPTSMAQSATLAINNNNNNTLARACFTSTPLRMTPLKVDLAALKPNKPTSLTHYTAGAGVGGGGGGIIGSPMTPAFSKKIFSTAKQDRRSSYAQMARPWRSGLSVSPRKRGLARTHSMLKPHATTGPTEAKRLCGNSSDPMPIIPTTRGRRGRPPTRGLRSRGGRATAATSVVARRMIHSTSKRPEESRAIRLVIRLGGGGVGNAKKHLTASRRKRHHSVISTTPSLSLDNNQAATNHSSASKSVSTPSSECSDKSPGPPPPSPQSMNVEQHSMHELVKSNVSSPVSTANELTAVLEDYAAFEFCIATAAETYVDPNQTQLHRTINRAFEWAASNSGSTILTDYYRGSSPPSFGSSRQQPSVESEFPGRYESIGRGSSWGVAAPCNNQTGLGAALRENVNQYDLSRIMNHDAPSPPSTLHPNGYNRSVKTMSGAPSPSSGPVSTQHRKGGGGGGGGGGVVERDGLSERIRSAGTTNQSQQSTWRTSLGSSGATNQPLTTDIVTTAAAEAVKRRSHSSASSTSGSIVSVPALMNSESPTAVTDAHTTTAISGTVSASRTGSNFGEDTLERRLGSHSLHKNHEVHQQYESTEETRQSTLSGSFGDCRTPPPQQQLLQRGSSHPTSNSPSRSIRIAHQSPAPPVICTPSSGAYLHQPPTATSCSKSNTAALSSVSSWPDDASHPLQPPGPNPVVAAERQQQQQQAFALAAAAAYVGLDQQMSMQARAYYDQWASSLFGHSWNGNNAEPTPDAQQQRPPPHDSHTNNAVESWKHPDGMRWNQNTTESSNADETGPMSHHGSGNGRFWPNSAANPSDRLHGSEMKDPWSAAWPATNNNDPVPSHQSHHQRSSTISPWDGSTTTPMPPQPSHVIPSVNTNSRAAYMMNPAHLISTERPDRQDSMLSHPSAVSTDGSGGGGHSSSSTSYPYPEQTRYSGHNNMPFGSAAASYDHFGTNSMLHKSQLNGW